MRARSSALGVMTLHGSRNSAFKKNPGRIETVEGGVKVQYWTE